MHDAPYRTIPVKTPGGWAETKVSPEDYEWLAESRWHGVQGYVTRNGRENEPLGVYMHRQIMGMTKGDGLEVDHIDRDPLNNCRSNLRVVDRQENARNVSARRGTSRYRGVCWEKRLRKWKAQAKFDGLNYLGLHLGEDDAARAVNAFWIAKGYPAPNEIG